MSKPRSTTSLRKMSDIMKEMSHRLLRQPDVAPSPEAMHVALFFANLAWNECIGMGVEREEAKSVWQAMEAENPALWDELTSRDIDALIDELVQYKQHHFPDDRRRILTCGGTNHNTIRVEWLPPAAPGVDGRWETQLYGLVRTGLEDEAIRFLRRTRGMSEIAARREVDKIAGQLGIV